MRYREHASVLLKPQAESSTSKAVEASSTAPKPAKTVPAVGKQQAEVNKLKPQPSTLSKVQQPAKTPTPTSSAQKGPPPVAAKGSAAVSTAKSTHADSTKKTTASKVAALQTSKVASTSSAQRDRSGKPPVARQGSSQEDSVSLNAKVESIKAAHERRLNEQKHAKENMPESSKRAGENRASNHEEEEEEGHARPSSKHRFRILSRRSSSSKPSLNCPGSKSRSMDKEETPTLREDEDSLLPIPIAHFAGGAFISLAILDTSGTKSPTACV